jgi:hypothetical protein
MALEWKELGDALAEITDKLTAIEQQLSVLEGQQLWFLIPDAAIYLSTRRPRPLRDGGRLVARPAKTCQNGPVTPVSAGLQDEESACMRGFFVWAVRGSNTRPPACKAGAGVRTRSRPFVLPASLQALRYGVPNPSERERTLAVPTVPTEA